MSTFHREDIKAELRKRYGTLGAFQEAFGLKGQAVRDLLRGKSNAARAAVANVMGVDPAHLKITTAQVPLCGRHTSARRARHRLNGGAK